MKTEKISISGLIMLLIMTVLTAPAFAQEKAAYSSEVAIDKKFNAIEVGGVFKVFLQQGTEQIVRFEAKEDIAGKVWAEVKGTTLTFGTRNVSPSKVTIYVNYVSLERLEATGAASVTGLSVIQSEKFDLETSGAAKVSLQLDVKNLVSETSGAVDLKLSGRAEYHRAEISGAANMKAWELETSKANVEVSGAAQAKLNVKDEIKGETSGVGKINLKQEPAIKNIEKTGVSKIITGEDTGINQDGITRIELGDDRVITIDNNGIVINSDSGTGEPLIINDEGVRIILKEKSKDGSTETKVLVINDEGVKVVNKKSKKDHDIHLGKKKDGKFNGHWQGLDLGVNGYLNADGNMDFPKAYNYLDLRMEKSINVRINFLEQNFNLIRNHVGLITGLGLEYNNYRFDNNVRLGSDENGIIGYFDKEPNTTYKKSKLVVNYLNLPLLLEYQTNNKDNLNSFHLAAGIVGGLRIGSHTKIVYDSGKYNKDKEKDDFYLNPFKWDATVRAGWGVIDLYATYSMSTLFKKDKGPELYPFSIGFTLGNM